MSESIDPPINPYAAPEAPLGAPVTPSTELAEMEATRRKYLSHEASVKSVGSLHILGAIVLILAVVAMLAASASDPNGNSLPTLLMAGFFVGLLALNLALGIGLTKLQNWARWVDVAFMGLGVISAGLQTIMSLIMTSGQPGMIAPILFGNSIGLLINGYILYLLVSSKATVVFSPEYKEVIKATPHIKYKTSCLVKGFLFLLVAMIILAIVGAFLGRR